MKDLKINNEQVLILAIGNCGRGDDGLGWEFADLLHKKNIKNIHIEYRYQLQVEDAELICNYNTILFTDASHEKPAAGFEIKPCTAAAHFYFSSHMQSPETILYLAKNLYTMCPDAYTLAIAGHDWKLKNSLSKKAEKNLHAAFTFFMNAFLPSLQIRLGNREDAMIVL